MKTVLFLMMPLALFAQTDLPGPVGALPNGVPTGVCSWNTAQTFKSCFVADGSLGGNMTITSKFGELNINGDLVGAALKTANNDVDAIGSTTNRYTFLFAEYWYNYAAGAMGMLSNTGAIALDTVAAQPIQFYTNNTLRGQFLSTGELEIANLAGRGLRCVHVNNSGDLSLAPADCSGGGPAFNDNIKLIQNVSDTTKGITFSAASISSGVTRTLTAQDGNYTIAGTNIAETFLSTQTFTATPAIVLGNELQPQTDNAQSIGDTTHNLAFVFTTDIYNYVPSSALGILSNSSLAGIGIAIDSVPNASIAFLTNNTLRMSITGSGELQPSGTITIGDSSNQFSAMSSLFYHAYVAGTPTSYCDHDFNGYYCQTLGTQQILLDRSTGSATFTSLAGIGTRPLCSTNVGLLTNSGCSGGGVTSVTGTSPINSSGGSTPAISCPTCVVSVGASSPLSSSGGTTPLLSCSTCVTDANTTLNTSCGTITLTGSYQALCSFATITKTGTWFVTASIYVISYTTQTAGIFYLDHNGSPLTGIGFGTFGRVCTASCPTDVIGGTVSQSFVQNFTVGDTIGMDGIQGVGGGTTVVNGGNMVAVFLHS
jgi:hypothetical protein